MDDKNKNAENEPLEKRAVAVINGEEISRKKFLRYYYDEWIDFQSENPKKSISQSDDERIKCQIIDTLMDTALLIQHSKNFDIKVDKDLINVRVDLIKKSYKSNLDYEIDLEELEASEDELKKDIEEEIIVNKILSIEKEKRVQITEDFVISYYEDNKHSFSAENAVHVAHIFIEVKDGLSQAEQKVKLSKMQEIYAKINAGESFENLAREYSECPSRENDGDLGIIIPGFSDIDDVFEDIALSVKPGDVSKIFDSSKGLHIVKVYEKIRNYAPEYDKIKNRLTEFLTEKLWEVEKEGLINDLREKAEIQIFNF